MNVILSEVQRKAKRLLSTLKEHADKRYNQEFIANNGWFRRSCHQYRSHYVVARGEEASCSEDVRNFIDELDNLLKQEHLPGQIFNVDKMSLY